MGEYPEVRTFPGGDRHFIQRIATSLATSALCYLPFKAAEHLSGSATIGARGQLPIDLSRGPYYQLRARTDGVNMPHLEEGNPQSTPVAAITQFKKLCLSKEEELGMEI